MRDQEGRDIERSATLVQGGSCIIDSRVGGVVVDDDTDRVVGLGLKDFLAKSTGDIGVGGSALDQGNSWQSMEIRDR